MKLTKSQLRKLVQEEFSKAIKKESAGQEETAFIEWATNLTRDEANLLMRALETIEGLESHMALDGLYELLMDTGDGAGWTDPSLTI